MNATLVDSCVFLDVLTDDPHWGSWSSDQLALAADRRLLVINPIIYSEVSIGFETIEELDEIVCPENFELRKISRPAAFLAGKSFLQYRRRGGSKTQPLPDFFIGAQAAIEKLPLLTRDVRRFSTYFPTVKIISPD